MKLKETKKELKVDDCGGKVDIIVKDGRESRIKSRIEETLQLTSA